MNHKFFFLICGILTFASATVITSSNGSVLPIAFGESYRGYDYLEVTNPDGSYSRTIGLPPYIYDNGTNSFVPFINDGLTTETEHGSVILNNGIYEFYPNGKIDGLPKFTDHIIGKYADITNLNSWTYLGQINNAIPTDTWTGNSFVTSKVKTGLGLMEYKYILDNSKWKTQLEATNLTPQTTKVFGFDQVINLNSDSIKFGGITRNLDNFDGMTFDKDFLERNEGKVIDLMNGFYFDFDLGFENLHSVTVYDTGVNSSQLVFDYRMDTVLLPGETLIIDPNYGYFYVDQTNERVTTSSVSGTSCGTPSSWGSHPSWYRGESTASTVCALPIFTFPLSNLPDNAVITDTQMRYDITTSSNNLNTAWKQISTDPTSFVDSNDYQGFWDEVINGATYLDDANKAVANDYVVDLGATADSDITAALTTTDEFWLGAMPTAGMTRDAGLDRVYWGSGTGDMQIELTLTYNLPPDPPKQVSTSITPSTGVGFTWSAGANNGDTHQTYEVERLNEDGVTWDELVSQTGTGYTDTQPYQNNTAMYRIWDTGLLGTGCPAFAMNSTIVANLTSHFPFCYTVNDNGSLDNDGTVTGNELYTNSSGIVSFDFDGSSYVTLPNESDYDYIDINTEWSIVIGHFEYNTSGTYETVIAKSNAYNTNTGFTINKRDVDDISIWMRTSTPQNNVIDSTSLTINTPYHIVITNDGSGNKNGVNFYVNGVLDSTGASGSMTGNIQNNLQVAIGDDSNGGNGFNGDISNIMFLDRELDSNEIEQLYLERIDTSTLALIGPPVTDLTGTATSFSTIELSWTTPSYIFGTFAGYMINYTTPAGAPTTIIVNNTETSDTDYEIFGLDEVETYSFRVGTWNEFGLNGSGNIFNATTTANFIIGNIDIPTETNPNVVDISFTETNINATAKQVTVQYPNTFTLNCDLAYQFAQTNQTYSNLTGTAVDADYDSYYFNFTNVDNEIINIECWNDSDPTQDAEYVITQTSFPLLDQIANFRNGTYGTQGMFGVIDFITLAVIIFSMIGFNRVNNSVGLIFNVALIGALGYFEIIEVHSIVFGAIAVVVMFTITSTRKV